MCLSCTRISKKVPGKLGGASTTKTGLLSTFPRHHVARSRFRTSIQTLHIRILQQQQSLSDIARLHVQNSPAYRFLIPRFQRAIHDSCSPSKAQPSAERNSTMPLPAFFVSRWLLAEQPAISDAVLCFFQPSSVEIALNAVKFPFALCWSKQNTTPHW